MWPSTGGFPDPSGNSRKIALRRCDMAISLISQLKILRAVCVGLKAPGGPESLEKLSGPSGITRSSA